jgi:hypothetical protein
MSLIAVGGQSGGRGRDVPGLPTVLRETAAHSAPDTTLKLSSFHFAMSPW